MPGASLMMRFFGSPPRESRSASGPGTEADYQQGGGEDPGALRAARTSGKGREAGRPPSCTRRRRPTSRRSAEAADRNLTTRATQPTETGLAGWACRIRTGESLREQSDWNSVTTSPGVGASPRRRPFAGELRDTGLQLQPRFHQANLARKSGQHHEDRVASDLIVGLEFSGE